MTVMRAHTDLRGIPKVRRFMDSERDTSFWVNLEKSVKKHFGIDTGAAYVRGLRESEHNFDYWNETFMGIPPLQWQSNLWNNGLMRKTYACAMLGNSGGKTVSFVLYYNKAAFWREWSPEWWGQYRILHHAPQEVQALECKRQFDEILRGQHRAQRKWVPARAGKKGGHKGHWEYRPCLIAPFVEAVKHDDGKHQGYDWFGGSSTLTFRSTAFKAKSSDGADPYFIGEDELRHEMYVEHVVQAIFLPRFLRVPRGRLYLPFTPLEASPELVEIYNRGATGTDPDWYSFNDDLQHANPTVDADDIARLERNTDKRLHRQILKGTPTQAANARFNQLTVEPAFIGTKQRDDLDLLPGLRARTMARCPSCKAQRGGDARYKSHRHRMVGFGDPASSSDSADDIAFAVWDLEPFFDGRINDPLTPICVYIKQAEKGTEEVLIQNIAQHLSDISQEIDGPVGYDLNSALGHNVGDLVVDLNGDFIGIDKHTHEEKLRSVDFLKGLVDRGLYRSYYHARTKAQMMSWQPRDRRLKQDFLMVQVGCADIAMPDLPDFITNPDEVEAIVKTQREAAPFDGFGDGNAWGPVPDMEQEPYGPYAVSV